MIAVGVDELSEVLVGLHECLDILRHVLIVHIVVGQSVTDEQLSAQLRSPLDGVHVVALGILLWCTHIALSVDGIVKAPVGGCRDGHSCAEHGPTLAHRHQRAEAAERPSPDADAVLVDKRLSGEPEGGLHLVAGLELTQSEVGTLLEGGSPSAGAPPVDTYADEALLCQILFEDSARAAHTDAPLVEHLLRTRSAVLIHDDGIAPLGVEILGFHHPSVERDALCRLEGEQLTAAQVVGGELLL